MDFQLFSFLLGSLNAPSPSPSPSPSPFPSTSTSTSTFRFFHHSTFDYNLLGLIRSFKSSALEIGVHCLPQNKCLPWDRRFCVDPCTGNIWISSYQLLSSFSRTSLISYPLLQIVTPDLKLVRKTIDDTYPVQTICCSQTQHMMFTLSPLGVLKFPQYICVYHSSGSQINEFKPSTEVENIGVFQYSKHFVLLGLFCNRIIQFCTLQGQVVREVTQFKHCNLISQISIHPKASSFIFTRKCESRIYNMDSKMIAYPNSIVQSFQSSPVLCYSSSSNNQRHQIIALDRTFIYIFNDNQFHPKLISKTKHNIPSVKFVQIQKHPFMDCIMILVENMIVIKPISLL